jgi:hypothetical protein
MNAAAVFGAITVVAELRREEQRSTRAARSAIFGSVTAASTAATRRRARRRPHARDPLDQRGGAHVEAVPLGADDNVRRNAPVSTVRSRSLISSSVHM